MMRQLATVTMLVLLCQLGPQPAYGNQGGNWGQNPPPGPPPRGGPPPQQGRGPPPPGRGGYPEVRAMRCFEYVVGWMEREG